MIWIDNVNLLFTESDVKRTKPMWSDSSFTGFYALPTCLEHNIYKMTGHLDYFTRNGSIQVQCKCVELSYFGRKLVDFFKIREDIFERK